MADINQAIPIHRDEDGNETAYCEGEVVPEYGTEITADGMPATNTL